MHVNNCEIMTSKQSVRIQYRCNFLKSIFDLWLIEVVNAEPVDTRSMIVNFPWNIFEHISQFHVELGE
jgi:hypothetical protein